MSLVSFYFRITNVTQRQGVRSRSYGRGGWLPPAGRDSVPTTSQLFYFDGSTVYDHSSLGNPPTGSQVFGTCSMYHDFSHFWAVDYDVTQNAVNEGDNRDWSQIGFDHGNGVINWVGIGGEHRRLGVQRAHLWTRALFPENHQPGQYSVDENCGGLYGDLPVLIALIAFSMPLEYLYHALNTCMQQGYWNGHEVSHIRSDRRGIVVTVYVVPGCSSKETLEQFERRRIFPA